MLEGKPSVDPIPVLLERGARSALDDSVAAGLVGLVYLARQAFEEKRRRQCLEITNEILKIEPEHEEALRIQTSVRSELERDFASAQALARDARSKNDQSLYGQAKAVLRRIVEATPDNLEAKALLLETVSSGYFTPPPDPAPSGRRMPRPSVLIGAVAVVVLVAVLALSKGTASRGLAQAAAGAGVSTNAESLNVAGVPGQPDPLVEPARAQTPLDDTVAVSFRPVRDEGASPLLRMENSDRSLAAAPLSRAPVRPVPDVIAAPAMGALAVSAAVPVEIYRGEEHLGSTPTTLQLPAGAQTLEYRYQGLRQSVSHVIKSQETTTATISFVIKVQVNARPWAQVSLEGTPLKPLGQTPLGDINVPIGSVLVFQNPGFPDKRHRVTAGDTAIQVSFP